MERCECFLISSKGDRYPVIFHVEWGATARCYRSDDTTLGTDLQRAHQCAEIGQVFLRGDDLRSSNFQGAPVQRYLWIRIWQMFLKALRHFQQNRLFDVSKLTNLGSFPVSKAIEMLWLWACLCTFLFYIKFLFKWMLYNIDWYCVVHRYRRTEQAQWISSSCIYIVSFNVWTAMTASADHLDLFRNKAPSSQSTIHTHLTRSHGSPHLQPGVYIAGARTCCIRLILLYACCRKN